MPRLELENKELEYVGNVLAQRPYAEVAQLIAKIGMQVNDRAFQEEVAALKKAAESPADTAASLKDGPATNPE
jgi:hypothetical protein